MAALLLFYVSGLPTLLHFAVAHAEAASEAADDPRDPPTPHQDHAKDCGAWHLLAGGLSDAPPPPVAPAPEQPTAFVSPLAANPYVSLDDLTLPPARGPPRHL